MGIIGDFVDDSMGDIGICIASQKHVPRDDPLKQFRAESLKSHNLKRVTNCASQLTLDDNLNSQAQDLAEKIAAVDELPPVYDASKMVTVFWTPGNYLLNGIIPVDMFFNEKKFFNFDNPDFSSAMNYPKIVWKSSKKMGVGRAHTSDNGTTFVVTVYDWTGDMNTTNIEKMFMQHDVHAHLYLNYQIAQCRKQSNWMSFLDTCLSTIWSYFSAYGLIKYALPQVLLWLGFGPLADISRSSRRTSQEFLAVSF
ncbi:hypothetical protein I4U23_005400 [Adineta vaga]|nr:hypothetical protein I4U23_005400 [Adineta vaga]